MTSYETILPAYFPPTVFGINHQRADKVNITVTAAIAAAVC